MLALPPEEIAVPPMILPVLPETVTLFVPWIAIPLGTGLPLGPIVVDEIVPAFAAMVTSFALMPNDVPLIVPLAKLVIMAEPPLDWIAVSPRILPLLPSIVTLPEPEIPMLPAPPLALIVPALLGPISTVVPLMAVPPGEAAEINPFVLRFTVP